MKKLNRLSNIIWPILLLFTIPVYLVLYAASGHNFNFSNEDIFWITTIVGALISFAGSLRPCRYQLNVGLQGF